MRLLELMDPSFKSFYNRDPFKILTSFINGLHSDLNQASLREESGTNPSYPGFENSAMVELDYIQADKWDKYYKERDDSPILNMF